MKNKLISLLTAILCILIIASFAAADAGFYPIGQQQNETQSYPIPQYIQPQPQPQPQQQQQQQPYGYNTPYYNNPYYNNPYYNNPYYNNPYYNNPYYYPNSNPPATPEPYSYPVNPQPNYNNQQQGPYYDPNSGYYFYPVKPQQPQQPQWPQPNRPGNPNNNVQVSTQWRYNGTVDLTWTIRNVSTEDWGKKNFDIKCTGGCYLLTNPNQTLWDLPYTVNRNDRLSFTVNIRQPGPYDDPMTFAIVAGSKTIYTFSVSGR